MRSTRPDAVPPPRLPECAENVKLHQKGQGTTAAMNLGFLLSLPALALLKNTGLLFWLKLLGAVLAAALCIIVDRVLFRRILSPEKWDELSYEECLHRASGRTVLFLPRGHRRTHCRSAVLVLRHAAANVKTIPPRSRAAPFGAALPFYASAVPSSRNSRVMHHSPAMPTSV